MKIEFLGTPSAGSFHPTSPVTDTPAPRATSPDAYQGPRANLAAQASLAANAVDGWMVRAELFIATLHSRVVGFADGLSNTATGFVEGLRAMLRQFTQSLVNFAGAVTRKTP